MGLNDLKYKLGDVGTNLKYKMDDVKGSGKGKTIILGGGIGLVLLVVFLLVWLPRLTGGSGPSEAVRIAEHRGTDQQWIDKANAAIANDPRFANVVIESGATEDGAAIIRVRGRVASMTERMALLGKFVEVGKRDNVSVEVEVAG
ncbi:MAG: hypothetical protein KF757_12505 [Phycisphaeraceae bacterium]|nr:hypothetical protein [Phycisphaeraceae bacterium]MCW5762536.1 hypothetical protein [Phycisphaeraceae bacterium]